MRHCAETSLLNRGVFASLRKKKGEERGEGSKEGNFRRKGSNKPQKE